MNPPGVLLRTAALLRPVSGAARLLQCAAISGPYPQVARCSRKMEYLPTCSTSSAAPCRMSNPQRHSLATAAQSSSRRASAAPSPASLPPRPLQLAPLANDSEGFVDEAAGSGDFLGSADATWGSTPSSSSSPLYEPVTVGSGSLGLASGQRDDDDWAHENDAEDGEEDGVEEDGAGAEREKRRRSSDIVRPGEDRERVYLMAVGGRPARQEQRSGAQYSIEESLEELAQLAETAGLEVVGNMYQALAKPNPATYIGSGKVAELGAAVQELRVETVIFDDELSPGQLRNLEKMFGGKVKVCDRTALILDIFSQRAQTREGKLQVELAQVEYQLPRLTRMWTHLDRVGGGGQVKGTGEKQIETDKRELRDKVSQLKQELDQVRTHRRNNRSRRSQMPTPVVAIVGYTNSGKSTLLNRLTAAGVLAEDKLFATLDPTTRRIRLPSNKEVLLTDTVGFIQKLPTELVAAFRATLEEIEYSAMLLHIVDISHPGAMAQVEAVEKVLADLAVGHLPIITAWNKVDACEDVEAVRAAARKRPNTLCISGLTGEGLPELLEVIQRTVESSMAFVHVLLPYNVGGLLEEVYTIGSVQSKEYSEHGTTITAFVPAALAGRLQKYALDGSEDTSSRDSLDSELDIFDADGFIEESPSRIPA